MLSDFKTRVESNLQEALRPIDGIASQPVSDTEGENMRRKIKDLYEEGQQLALKLSQTEAKLKQKSRLLDSMEPDPLYSEISAKDAEISDLQMRGVKLSQEFTNFRFEKDREISELRCALAQRDADIANLTEKLKITEASETRNFQPIDWQLRYEGALQAIGELEEKLEETQEEISVLRDELKRKFISRYICLLEKIQCMHAEFPS